MATERAQRLRGRLQQLQEDTETVVTKKRLAIQALSNEVVTFEEKAKLIGELLTRNDEELLAMLDVVCESQIRWTDDVPGEAFA